MKNKLKNILLTIPLALSISCATIKPHASLDVSYVPSRIIYESKKNELRSELDLNAEIKIKESKLVIGTTQTTYANFSSWKFEGIFSPTSQNYEIYSKLFFQLGNFDTELYAYHNCFHPINKEMFAVLDIDDKHYGLFSSGETRIGVKIRF